MVKNLSKKTGRFFWSVFATKEQTMATEYQNNFETYAYRLALYYHLKTMDPFRAANFAKLKADGKLNIAQNKWNPQTKPDPNSQFIQDANGVNSPNPIYMDDEQWEQLYKIFSTAFRNMAKHTADLNQKDTLPFFNKYYNANPAIGIFGPAQISQANAADMQTLANLLIDPNNGQINAELMGLLHSELKTQTEYRNFVGNLLNPNAASNDFADKLNNVLVTLNNKAYESASVDDNLGINPFGNQQNAINIYRLTNNLYKNVGVETPHPLRMAQFKADFSKNGGLLETLFAKGKTIGSDFAKNGGKSVTDIIETAKTENDFAAGDNAIAGKDEDVLTRFDKISKTINESVDASIGKLTQRHRREIYDSPAASSIVEAIIGAKVKPTDGLDAVLKNIEAIKTKVQNKHPGAVTNLDWLTKQLKEVQEQMPKAFAGALRNGRQMNAIVKHIIVNAAKSGDKAKCLVAMEVLSVIQYDNFSSKIRDDLFKDKLVITGNMPSIQKSEVLKGMATAFDATLKFGARAVFETANLLKNRINKNGLTFKRDELRNAKVNVSTVQNDIDFERLAAGAQQWTVQQSEQFKNQAEQALQTAQQQLANKNQEILQKEQQIAQMGQIVQPFLDARQDIQDSDAEYAQARDSALAILTDLKNFRDATNGGYAPSPEELKQNKEQNKQLKNALKKRADAATKKLNAQVLLAGNPQAQQQIAQYNQLRQQLATLKQQKDTIEADIEIKQADFDLRNYIFEQKQQAETTQTAEAGDVYEMMQYWNYKNKFGERLKRNDLGLFRGANAHKAKQAAYNAANNNPQTNQTLIMFNQFLANQHP